MNRKEFLADCGKMSLAGMALSLFPWLQSCSDEAKREVRGEKVRIGVIGTGSRGIFHIKHLLQMPAPIWRTRRNTIPRPNFTTTTAVCWRMATCRA